MEGPKQSYLKNLPELSLTIKKLKEDFTFEKQYDSLIDYDIVPPTDPDLLSIRAFLSTPPKDFPFTLKESKGIACFLGLVIGDAAGNVTDGFPLDYKRKVFSSFQDYKEFPRLPLGLYSDDSAMALCIADSILANNMSYDAKDIKYRMLLWWYEGLNNGKAILKLSPEIYKAKCPFDLFSFGIGSTIWCSLLCFIRNPSQPYVDSNDSILPKKGDGNGSIMRLAPIALAFNDRGQELTDFARDQSFLTHHGEEAAQCCQLLANILAILLNDPRTEGFITKEITERKKFLKEVCEEACIKGAITLDSVKALALSAEEEWNWMAESFEYSKERSVESSTFIGVYCMDCLAMALHLNLYSKSFGNVIVKSVNLGGDADTVSAVAGQIAGCLYGISDEMLDFYRWVRPWDQEKTFVRGFKLIKSLS